MNALYKSFRDAARREPRRPLLCPRPGGAWLTAGNLLEETEELASGLRGAGLSRGGILMLVAGNVPGFVAATIAAWACGAALLPAEPSLPESEIRRLVRAFRPALLVRDRAGRTEILRPEPPGRPAAVMDAAIIRLTSGTTRAALGAIIPSAALSADGRAIIRKMGIGRDDINVGVVPLGHSYGFDNLILPLLLQGTPLILLESPLPGLLHKALGSPGPLILPLVPYLVDLVSRHPEPPPRPSGLRLCISAGAPLPRAMAARFREKFGVPVRTFYGASETGGIAYDDSRDADAPEGCVGTPLPGVRMTIERTRLPGLSPGEGRVTVSGRAVGRGYHPKGSAEFRPGRFRTMDLGYTDADGRLFLTGRVSNLVNVSGRKVNPAEVERTLLSLDGIADAAVVGIKDRLRGERIEAWVVGLSDQGPAFIRAELARRLSAHKVPRTIHLVESIPRTARGKLDRIRLLEAR